MTGQNFGRFSGDVQYRLKVRGTDIDNIIPTIFPSIECNEIMYYDEENATTKGILHTEKNAFS